MPHRRPDRRQLRVFGFQIGGAVAVVFGLVVPLLRERPVPLWPWIVFGVLAVPAVVAPSVLAPLYRGWMRFAAVVGAINSRILLTAVFVLVFTPIGLVMRLFGRDPLRRRRDPRATSYRVASTAPAANHMTRPF